MAEAMPSFFIPAEKVIDRYLKDIRQCNQFYVGNVSDLTLKL